LLSILLEKKNFSIRQNGMPYHQYALITRNLLNNMFQINVD